MTGTGEQGKEKEALQPPPPPPPPAHDSDDDSDDRDDDDEFEDHHRDYDRDSTNGDFGGPPGIGLSKTLRA